jgi:hypothetical protein
MPKIYITFQNRPPLELHIIDTDLGYNYASLVKKNYENSFPVYRDRPKYTEKYMMGLAEQASVAFNWHWSADHYSLNNTPLLHKDLEHLLGTTGFTQVPEQYDHLLHELHYCLHIVQHPDTVGTRMGFLQIEWFNDDGFDLDTHFKFQHHMQFGDLQLQNPFVGHGPAQIFFENDYYDLDLTCKFHTFVKPGIVINVNTTYCVDPDQVIKKFQAQGPDFVARHGVEKIRHYTGFPVIGQIKNTKLLQEIVDCPNELFLEKLEFDL